MKNLFKYISLILICIIMSSLSAMADNFDARDGFWMRPTFADIKRLEIQRPDQARAYIRGVADTTFAFYKGNICPPPHTRIDVELIKMALVKEVRLHNKREDEYFADLVKAGLQRDFPCE